MLALGVCTPAMDGYCRISENIAIECTKRFCVAICIKIYEHHLKKLTQTNFKKQLAITVAHGFPKMFVLLDCITNALQMEELPSGLAWIF
jgi:hypothetical protein